MMKFLVIEYIVLTLLFLTLLFVGNHTSRRSKLVVVHSLRHKCTTDWEEHLFDQLTRKGFYVTPAVPCRLTTIPIALLPYKVAIFSFSKKRWSFLQRIVTKQKILYVRSNGWTVFTFPEEKLKGSTQEVVDEIVSQLKVRKA